MIDEVDERNLSRAGAGAGVDVEGWFHLGQDGRPMSIEAPLRPPCIGNWPPEILGHCGLTAKITVDSNEGDFR
jgi:hypothetical protein